MARLIDANLLSESIWDNVSAIYEDARCAKEDCLAEIEASPAVDAVQAVHGRWIEHQIPHVICCSNCDWATDAAEKNFLYCPMCGARMDGEE